MLTPKLKKMKIIDRWVALNLDTQVLTQCFMSLFFSEWTRNQILRTILGVVMGSLISFFFSQNFSFFPELRHESEAFCKDKILSS